MHSKEFEEEYEIIKSIYTEIELGEEKTINNETIVSIVLYPATCDDDETRYVTLGLEFNIPATYPASPPTILFKNPRGLSESKLIELHEELKQKCYDELLDTPMLFQIIDMVQDFLTANNCPASDCPICLDAFHKSDVFFRSKCFHYFHSQCIGKFLQNIVNNSENSQNSSNSNGASSSSDSKLSPEFLCPVCREELDQTTFDIDKLLDAPPPHGELEEQEFAHGGGSSSSTAETSAEGSSSENGSVKILNNNSNMSAEWLQQREQMKLLYEKQEKQGGIIDLNAHTKKLLIISTPAAAAASSTDELSIGSDGGAAGPPANSVNPAETTGINLLIRVSSSSTINNGSAPNGSTASSPTVSKPSSTSTNNNNNNPSFKVASGHFNHRRQYPHHRHHYPRHAHSSNNENGSRTETSETPVGHSSQKSKGSLEDGPKSAAAAGHAKTGHYHQNQCKKRDNHANNADIPSIIAKSATNLSDSSSVSSQLEKKSTAAAANGIDKTAKTGPGSTAPPTEKVAHVRPSHHHNHKLNGGHGTEHKIPPSEKLKVSTSEKESQVAPSKPMATGIKKPDQDTDSIVEENHHGRIRNYNRHNYHHQRGHHYNQHQHYRNPGGHAHSQRKHDAAGSKHVDDQ